MSMLILVCIPNSVFGFVCSRDCIDSVPEIYYRVISIEGPYFTGSTNNYIC